jgi:hypothetical protein
MPALCKIMRGEIFKTFVVAVSVYDANFTAIAAGINVRVSDDLMNGNCPQAAAWRALPQTLPIVFSLSKQQLKTHQILPVCLGGGRHYQETTRQGL